MGMMSEGRRPGVREGWQETGYRMEKLRSAGPALTAKNDSGHTPPRQRRHRRPPRVEAEASGRKRRAESRREGEAGLDERIDHFSTVPLDERDRLRPAPSRASRRALLLLLLVVLAAGAVAGFSLLVGFPVRTILVEGNLRVPSETVVALSGVKQGDNLLGLNEDQIRANLRKNQYLDLVCVDIAKDFSGTVTLVVEETPQISYVLNRGIIYVLDPVGTVLEEWARSGATPALIRVEGLDIRNCVVGKTINLYREAQLFIYVNLISELQAMQAVDKVTEIYLTTQDEIFVATQGGYSFSFGSSDNLHAKVRLMLMVQEDMLRRGLTGGTVDLSSGEGASYIPEAVPVS